MNTTPVSLLVRLCQSRDDDAWQRIVELYTPLLLYWGRRLGLQEADVADLVQEVFAVLVEALPRFESRQGERFRGWLWTITINRHRERQRLQARQPAEQGKTPRGSSDLCKVLNLSRTGSAGRLLPANNPGRQSPFPRGIKHSGCDLGR